MGRKTEIKARVEFERLTEAAKEYLDEAGFASGRELGTILAKEISMREISPKIVGQVIEAIRGQETKSGKIIVKIERKHKRPYVIVGAIDPTEISMKRKT